EDAPSGRDLSVPQLVTYPVRDGLARGELAGGNEPTEFPAFVAQSQVGPTVPKTRTHADGRERTRAKARNLLGGRRLILAPDRPHHADQAHRGDSPHVGGIRLFLVADHEAQWNVVVAGRAEQ